MFYLKEILIGPNKSKYYEKSKFLNKENAHGPYNAEKIKKNSYFKFLLGLNCLGNARAPCCSLIGGLFM